MHENMCSMYKSRMQIVLIFLKKKNKNKKGNQEFDQDARLFCSASVPLRSLYIHINVPN